MHTNIPIAVGFYFIDIVFNVSLIIIGANYIFFCSFFVTFFLENCKDFVPYNFSFSSTRQQNLAKDSSLNLDFLKEKRGKMFEPFFNLGLA